MKKSMLACSILLAGAGCAAENGELDAVQAEARLAQSNLIDHVFVSTSAYEYYVGEYDPVTGEYVTREVQAKARLTLIRAENYDLDGHYHAVAGDTGGLEYEIVVEHVLENGDTRTSDRSFFARKGAGGSYEFFDCDSSRKCQTAFKTRMEIHDTAEGATLTIENHDIGLVHAEEGVRLEFVEVR